MQAKIAGLVDRYDKIWLGVSLTLIGVPWFAHVAATCVATKSTLSYSACVVGSSPLVGISMMMGVVFALIYCKWKGIRAAHWHFLLQMAGLVGLLGLRSISSLTGVLYALVLIVIYAYKNPTGNDIQSSPIYTLLALALMFYLGFTSPVVPPWVPDRTFSLWWKQIFPKRGPAELFLYMALASSIITQALYWIWVKSRSVILFSASMFGFLAIAIYITIRLSFRYVLRF